MTEQEHEDPCPGFIYEETGVEEPNSGVKEYAMAPCDHACANNLLTLLAERDMTIQRTRAVIDWGMVEDDSWLGGMRTENVEGEDPGNQEYMDYLDRVLTAAGHTGREGFQWGPIILAIILDRHVRETEKFVALDGQAAS